MNLDELIDVRLAEATDLMPHQLYDEIVRDHPDAINKFLIDHEQAIVCEHIRHRLSAQRSSARRRAKVETFEQAVRALPSDEGVALRRFTGLLATRQALADGRQRVYGDCSKPDVVFIAETYDISGNRSRLLAEFHRQVAARLADDQTVADVFKPGTLEDLHDAITGPI